MIEKQKDIELKETIFVERLKGDFWSRAVYWVGPHISHLFSIPILLKIESRNYKDIFLSLPRIWIQISFGELVKVSSHFTKWISGIGNRHVFNQALLLLDKRLWGIFEWMISSMKAGRMDSDYYCWCWSCLWSGFMEKHWDRILFVYLKKAD